MYMQLLMLSLCLFVVLATRQVECTVNVSYAVSSIVETCVQSAEIAHCFRRDHRQVEINNSIA